MNFINLLIYKIFNVSFIFHKQLIYNIINLINIEQFFSFLPSYYLGYIFLIVCSYRLFFIIFNKFWDLFNKILNLFNKKRTSYNEKIIIVKSSSA